MDKLNQFLTESCEALLNSGEKSGTNSRMKSVDKIKDESFLYAKSGIFVMLNCPARRYRGFAGLPKDQSVEL